MKRYGRALGRRLLALTRRKRLIPADARRVPGGAGGASLDGWTNTDVDGSAQYVLDACQAMALCNRASLTHVFADKVIEHT